MTVKTKRQELAGDFLAWLLHECAVANDPVAQARWGTFLHEYADELGVPVSVVATDSTTKNGSRGLQVLAAFGILQALPQRGVYRFTQYGLKETCHQSAALRAAHARWVEGSGLFRAVFVPVLDPHTRDALRETLRGFVRRLTRVKENADRLRSGAK